MSWCAGRRYAFDGQSKPLGRFSVAWLNERQPDIVCLQETKCVDDAFPRMEFESLGYNVAIHGQKTFNGVAILSKFKFDATDEAFLVKELTFRNCVIRSGVADADDDCADAGADANLGESLGSDDVASNVVRKSLLDGLDADVGRLHGLPSPSFAPAGLGLMYGRWASRPASGVVAVRRREPWPGTAVRRSGP